MILSRMASVITAKHRLASTRKSLKKHETDMNERKRVITG